MLSDIGYVDLTEHAAEHCGMLYELQLVQESLKNYVGDHPIRRGSVLSPGWPVMQLILGFTVGHVATSDMSYYQALKASRDVSGATV